MNNPTSMYHRRGKPGGPGCPLGVWPVQSRDAAGGMQSFVLLDAGKQSSEIELLRTVASRMGVKWGQDELGWWAAAPVPDFPSWSVWRQDDNGNRFLMKANVTQSEASGAVDHYQSLGHKQHYWAENSRMSSGTES